MQPLCFRLPDSKKFRRDLSEERKSVFRSTIFPMDANSSSSSMPSVFTFLLLIFTAV